MRLIDSKATFDHYDRLLAHAYTSMGKSIQEHLLSNGLARVAYLYDDYSHTNEYRAAEKEAQTKNLNIHSIDGYVKWNEIAGFDMTVAVSDDWVLNEPVSVEEMVERMGQLKIGDFFNLDLSK